MTLVFQDKGVVRTDAAKGWPGAGGRARTARTSGSISLIGRGEVHSYARIYAGQPFIYALVNKLARGVGRLPLRAYRWDDEDLGLKVPAPTSEPGRLLAKPHPKGTRRTLVEAAVGSLAVYGRSYTWKFRGNGRVRPPTELWPLDARHMTRTIGPNEPVSEYVYNDGSVKKRFLPEDVIEIAWWSPDGERGTSPLEALRRTIALEDAALSYATSSFAHGVRPSGALVTERALDDDVRRELEAEMDAVHAGPDNAFRMMLLEGGLKWETFSHTAVEAQTIEHRKLNQIEACAVYDIPPPVVHILDQATYSNISEQNKALYRESLAPWLGAIEGDFWAQLIDPEPLWNGTANRFDSFFYEFDLREVLRADLGERADAYVKLLAVYTPNELRAMENLPPIDHPAADAILLPLNSTSVGPGFDVAPPPPTAEERQLASLLIGALRTNGDTKARALLDSFK